MLTREVLIYKGVVSGIDTWDIPVNTFLDPSVINKN
jgi:hypothetical protein